MAKSIEKNDIDLATHLSQLFRNAGLEVPATLPMEIATTVQLATRNEIERVLKSHFTAKFKPQP